ncbi:hypothetical protein EV643_12815 [Kribbella sp. VKM Ac-2527]|uniref:Uncharacterized protein n=1 Tax=Kribbella caucasensis TaxID=2512215 RepID=A0A4R6JEA3_9ACTN|nr:hypothetical protein [Kribbella sp. VKM Ac-2527]TDO34230.1 hypothetical protein EV643_12815 [Kribbella sp. VKM Ac-2527]
MGRVLLGVALVIGLGVLAIAFQATDPVRPGSDSSPPGAAVAPHSRTTPPATTVPLPTTAPPLPTTVSPTPSGLSPTPGIQLVANPRSDGALDVVETITVRTPTDRLVLSPPVAARTEAAFTALRASRPRADSVVVRAGGRPVPLRPPVVGTRRVLLLASPANRIELRYRLTGSVIRNSPSKPGRALGLIAPLTAEVDGSLPTLLTVGRARNFFCPLLDPALQRCAGEYREGLTSQPGLTAADATVLLQLDLPLPPRRA